ncbi:MAG: anthranilate phosphoribosyltransferase [Proteobacteria bacterium]|nr:anthranilate phosphoribosyltransferase [Pseudomonadota bacterium]
MSLRRAIDIAIGGEDVPGPVLEAAFGEIMDGDAANAQIAALLVALRAKGESVEEIVAAARAMRSRAETAPAPVDPRTVDTCGTGGDGRGTFNISTAAAFAVAGAGVPVAKHGNRAASSRTGSFDVLEALGVRVDLPVAVGAALLAEIGIAPFYARVAHPAMRFMAPVRQELGLRTLMNCLGPLLNPVGARFQLVGVYTAELVETLADALGRLGSRRALVVHGSDGLDEITTTGPTAAALTDGGKVERIEIDPAALGLPKAKAGDLDGGDAAESAEIVRAVLGGEKGPHADVVALNAGAALWVAEAAPDLAAGLAAARKSLESGAALDRLEALVVRSNEIAPG